jgi:hypothetical protein
MLLLTSGARHPYKIEEKYLKKRNINVENMDPYNISVYTLKELIWRDWREGTRAHSFLTFPKTRARPGWAVGGCGAIFLHLHLPRV